MLLSYINPYILSASNQDEAWLSCPQSAGTLRSESEIRGTLLRPHNSSGSIYLGYSANHNLENCAVYRLNTASCCPVEYCSRENGTITEVISQWVVILRF